jgi:hypothetical protein
MNENATSRQNFENAMKHPIEGTSFGYVRLLFFRRQRLICRAVDRTFGNESDLWFVIACRLPVKSGFSVNSPVQRPRGRASYRPVFRELGAGAERRPVRIADFRPCGMCFVDEWVGDWALVRKVRSTKRKEIRKSRT